LKKDILEKLITDKLSLVEISNRLNVSISTVKYWVKKYELKVFKKINEKRYCKNCEKLLFGSSKIYCNNKCQQDFQYKKWKIEYLLTDGLNVKDSKTLKRFVIERDTYKCNVCGIEEWNDKNIVLELEHIDGNSENNKEDNLELLCPNCHSQTDTYKSKNMGNGRYYRRKRYSEGKSF